MEIKENRPLKNLTTLKLGGEARFFVEARDENEVREFLNFAQSKNLPVFVLGGGSNILISDDGFPGVVIHNRIKKFEINNNQVTVGAGEDWDEVVKRCVEQNLAGIECLSGIPGSAGGAVVQNVGAYGQEISNLLKEVKAINVETKEEMLFSRGQCGFEYRDSIFKSSPGKFIITEFKLQLMPSGKPAIIYKDLKDYFVGRPNPSLSEVRQAVIEIRAKKGYVIMPGYESFMSAGSFFKNPVVTKEIYQNIKVDCPPPWFWQLPDEKFKISAACLLQETGFGKGYRAGNVGISPKHSLTLINYGNATAKEMWALSREIQDKVSEKFAIILEPEVQFVGL